MNSEHYREHLIMQAPDGYFDVYYPGGHKSTCSFDSAEQARQEIDRWEGLEIYPEEYL